MQLNCIVDTKGYSTKPKGYEIGSISNRLSEGKEQSLSLDEFKAELEQGKTYIAGHFKDRSIGREKSNMKDMNFFSLDVDNHYKVNGEDAYTNYTIQQAIDKVDEILNITPILSYVTFSKVNEINGSKRFRLIYGIDLSCGTGDIALILKYISNMTGDMFDKSAVDESRIFFSTNQEVIKYDNYKLLDHTMIDKLKDLMEAEEQEQISKVSGRVRKKRYRGNTSYTDDVIEELKQIDISSYLLNEGYSSINKTIAGYEMPCPIHKGKNNNFKITNENGIWLWICFSKCSKDGGSIIDLHMRLNNIDEGQAIRELKEMYNIKTVQDTERAKEIYTVDKYISDDKKATAGILEAIRDNKRVLVTGSMGTGKTHFILNNVLEYSRSIGKVLIPVIPNVSQLSNLYNNKDTPIVCQDMPVYMGNDIVATTPESLPKITAGLERDNKEYILVVDESHERYTSVDYRRGYKDKNIEKAEDTAYKSIHLTATPRLLEFDKFDKEINIQSKKVITNNVKVLKVKDKLDDKILSITKRALRHGYKPIVFNNNKEMNEILKEQLELKEKVSVVEFEQGQIDLLKDSKKTREIEKTIVSAETVKSGDIPKSIEQGLIDADVTITTSSIQAGIDLYTDDKAMLIVNTRNLLYDNIIQLVGRFREGIEVVLVVEDKDFKRKPFDLEYIINLSMRDSKDLADKLNSSKRLEDNYIDLSDAGIKKDASIERVSNKWIVDKTDIVRKVYNQWSETIINNTDLLVDLLKKEDAFKVENIAVDYYYDELETNISEAKKVSREVRAEKIEKAKDIMLDLSDAELEKALNREYKDFEEDTAEIVKEYFKIAHRHLEKIKTARDKLYTDAEGVRDGVGAFRHFYSNSWASIRREIEQKETIAVNKLIKEQGKDHLLSREAKRFKTSTDVVQARIMKEFEDIEEKQGRLSQDRLNKLRDLLIGEGYIRNKYTKTLDREDATEKDREKALKMLGDITKARVDLIYNFKGDKEYPFISSIKYE